MSGHRHVAHVAHVGSRVGHPSPTRFFRSPSLAVALMLACCRSDPAPTEISAAGSAAPAPADRGAFCMDVAGGRACWGDDQKPPGDEGCGEVGCWVDRPLPAGPAPASGYRCTGMADERQCEARSRTAGPFRCEGGVCRQDLVRVPDAGEWRCAAMHGALVCRLVVGAAGIPRGPREAGFVCGPRRGHRGEEICVDLSPDLPTTELGSGSVGVSRMDCGVHYAGHHVWRRCTETTAVQLGTACETDTVCPEGAACVTGRCLLPFPRPDCWFDRDCEDGAVCRLGTCRGQL